MSPSDESKKEETPFDPREPSIPISFPIKTLQDLESRSYFDSFHFPFNKSTVPIQSSQTSLPDRRRILVCHDMAGGYTDDKWVQGGNNPDAYSIWHWYLMDVFVYFSHNLVTLPPPSWINTAHNHGVKVLGTFITEWDEGKVIARILLSTKESAQMYAERLTELAVALGFDGWLINMEVQLDIEEIPMMKEFVSHLTQTMHAAVPGSLVIWYDSVTVDGKLRWQDQLNDSNKPFFDICDGIFVNYTWKVDYPKRSAAVAGDRKFDVYMGIDVFGRGTYGGGKWTTNVALDVIKESDVSAAIFAPGWVYETEQPPDFQTAQNRWWSLVEESWGILQKYPKLLPFFSNFDQGHGYQFNIDGKQVSNAPWNNISCQSVQPFLELSGARNPDDIQVYVDFKEASYNGGGNITFKGSLEDNTYFMTRLFQGELNLGNSPVHFKTSVKSDGTSMVGLCLELFTPTNSKTSVLLSAWGNPLITMNRFASKFSSVIMPRRVTELETAPGWVIQESSISMNGYTLTGIHALCYKSIPEVNRPKLESGSLGQSSYYAVLGHITVKTNAHDLVFPLSTSWIVESRHIKWTSGSLGSNSLSVQIIWTGKDENASVFTKYNIYVEKQTSKTVDKLNGVVERTAEYLGVAQVETFYVSDLVVPFGTSSLKFIIQVCGLDGSCQRLEDSPFLQLAVEGNDGLIEAWMTSNLPSSNSSRGLAVLGHDGASDTKGNELHCVVYYPVKMEEFAHHKKAPESLTDLRSVSCFIAFFIVCLLIYYHLMFHVSWLKTFLFCT